MHLPSESENLLIRRTVLIKILRLHATIPVMSAVNLFASAAAALSVVAAFVLSAAAVLVAPASSFHVPLLRAPPSTPFCISLSLLISRTRVALVPVCLCRFLRPHQRSPVSAVPVCLSSCA